MTSLLMIRPLHFGYNEETAASNLFQKKSELSTDILQTAQKEFDAVVELLKSKDIEVSVYEDREDVITPDSIFPNNWISVNNNTICIYPMLAASRRKERREDIINDIIKKSKSNLKISDLTYFENDNKYLEGTGSIIFDHESKLAYSCISPRTDKEILIKLCDELKYQSITFTAYDDHDLPVYHTNVMMNIGSGYAVICDECISDSDERKKVTEALIHTQHEIISITIGQLNSFAGNMLEVGNKWNEKFLLMSQRAHQSLSLEQVEKIKKHVQPLVCYIPSIEHTGGGSIRCMLAEIKDA